MIIYPDIEIQDGKSVNLSFGREDKPVIYDITPLDAAKRFQEQGAEWLHVVDLDGVFQGGKHNAEQICEIIETVDIPVQVGGGIRTTNTVDWWFEHGAERVVLSTAAVKDRTMVMEVCGRYPDKIVISVDASEGYAWIDGWRTKTSFTPLQLASELQDSGAAAIIYCDIDRFNDAPESSLAPTTEIGTALTIPVISTGTVRTLDDVSRLKYLPNIAGVVIGRALFTGAVNFNEALEIAQGPAMDQTLANQGVASPEVTLNTSSGLDIKTVDHIGIRISDLKESINFYQELGFDYQTDHGFKYGHPVVMRHPSGVVLNLLGPSTNKVGTNVLMDVEKKYSGITHVALRINSMEATQAFLSEKNIPITGSFEFGSMSAIFIRDPDRNVIELDAYNGNAHDESEPAHLETGYSSHP